MNLYCKNAIKKEYIYMHDGEERIRLSYLDVYGVQSEGEDKEKIEKPHNYFVSYLPGNQTDIMLIRKNKDNLSEKSAVGGWEDRSCRMTIFLEPIIFDELKPVNLNENDIKIDVDYGDFDFLSPPKMSEVKKQKRYINSVDISIENKFIHDQQALEDDEEDLPQHEIDQSYNHNRELISELEKIRTEMKYADARLQGALLITLIVLLYIAYQL